jgi:hypothetical protein
VFQNRIDPFGSLIKTKARGAWLGNRGVIHNEAQEIVRPFKLKAWITSVLQFKGRKRNIMQPNRWTELFFLDEATALAAGHRPCFECRRADADRFKFSWLKGNPEYGFDKKTSIKEIDAILHEERIDRGEKVKHKEKLKNLPNGIFIEYNDEAYLLRDNKIYKWMPAGYAQWIALPAVKEVIVLTPRSVVNMIRAGYEVS